ncbi:hypothetical protein PoB_001571000 [Plakobranchus ocellatus]|uniref:Uncharacterized protein n=1 Tax=Plakobranchus ocellatus TaxID=259542 RepID=A0AAV3Z231_9GAST|nr:hypothetical protein PoB_001571000 [Plakobranchus ocellatus]
MLTGQRFCSEIFLAIRTGVGKEEEKERAFSNREQTLASSYRSGFSAMDIVLCVCVCEGRRAGNDKPGKNTHMKPLHDPIIFFELRRTGLEPETERSQQILERVHRPVATIAPIDRQFRLMDQTTRQL